MAGQCLGRRPTICMTSSARRVDYAYKQSFRGITTSLNYPLPHYHIR